MTTMKPFLMAVPIMLSAALTCAQDAGLLQEKCTVAGTVIDAVSEQPLKGAEVRLRAIPGASAPGSQPASQSIPQPKSATADASGRFLFESISPGRYFLVASREGYVNTNRLDSGSRGKSIVLVPGQHINDVIIRLLPNGTIAGRIADEMGKALRGVSVEAMKSSYSLGRRDLHAVAMASSNDAGEYRIQALVPGKYYVRAKPPRSLKTKQGSEKAYVPTYYPAAIDRTRSVVLVLRAGEDLAGIDMNLAPVHAVHIRGRVINSRTALPSKEAEVTLLSDQGETVFLPGQNFSAAGQAAFEFQGVPPGSYILVAQQPGSLQEPRTIWGRTSIEVKDTNIEHADVVVGPGADIAGRIRVEDSKAADISKDFSNMVGILESQEASTLAGLIPDIDNASVKPDGTFIFREVPEGAYRISFFPVPPGFYLRSSGAGDVIENGVTVGRGHSPAAMELVLSSGAGRIDGTVANDKQSVPDASVVLVPEGKGRGQPNYYRQAVTDLLGRFSMRNVIPGDYTLFAWEQIERGAYFDPEFLGQYEGRGKAVHVEEGGRISVKLEVIPVAESAP